VKIVLFISDNLYSWDITGAGANLETLRKEKNTFLAYKIIIIFTINVFFEI